MGREGRAPGTAGAKGAEARGGASRTAERQITWQRWLGLLACAGGFAVVGLGWAGAARQTCVDCQIPYLLSGGAAGLGLLLFGTGMLVMAQVRTEGRRIASRLDRMAETSVRRAEMPDGIPGGQLVVAARSTYHRPDCKLVAGKTDLETMPLDAARIQGLSPCRVCDPDSAKVVSPETPIVVPVVGAVADEDLSAAEREAFGEEAVTAAVLRRASVGDGGAGEQEAGGGTERSGGWRRRRPRRRKRAGEV